MKMTRATKCIIAGLVLIILGFLLNELAIWICYWLALINAGEYPPPMAPIAFTGFIFLVPIGVAVLLYGLYLKQRESEHDMSQYDIDS